MSGGPRAYNGAAPAVLTPALRGADMRKSLWWPVPAAAILFAACAPGVRPEVHHPDRLLQELVTVSELDALSGALWPGWELSSTPFALWTPDSTCYLVHHPRPPVSFRRVRGQNGRIVLYHGRLASSGVARDACKVGGVPTAFLESSAFAADPVGVAATEAFRVLLTRACPQLLAPVELVVDSAMGPRVLAMVDLECELLERACSAPEESLLVRAAEFVAVRQLRFLTMGPRSADRELWLETMEGLPRYIGDRARELAPRYQAGGAAGPQSAGSPPLRRDPGGRADAEWYSAARFPRTGAGVCALLDRLQPGWRREVSGRCARTFDVLRGAMPDPLPRAADVFSRMDLDGRVAARAAAIDAAKTGEERLFESITEGPGPKLHISTRQLSSVSVSLDRQNMVSVDEHREVHMRILKLEFSGGTHVYLSGEPIAAELGGPFDYRQLTVRWPQDLRVTVDGEPVALEPGIRSAARSLEVEGEGVSVEARAGAVVVGEGRITLVLHQ